MKMYFRKITLLILSATMVFWLSCSKDDTLKQEEFIDYLAVANDGVKQGLDSLIDTISKDYGVQVYYKFTPRFVTPNNFYTPTSYDNAFNYASKVVRTMWLGPMKQRFPKFWAEQKPVEFLIIGSSIRSSSITAGTSTSAAINAQFYRLGMGNIDNLTFAKANIRAHLCLIYHEHAHQMDNKYGRGYAYDRVSQGEYYGIAFTSRNDEQAQKDGFFSAYGGYAPEEDFATTVEACIRFDKDSIMKIVAKNAKLKTKYEMVYNKYLGMGIDLHQMKVYLDSAANTL